MQGMDCLITICCTEFSMSCLNILSSPFLRTVSTGQHDISSRNWHCVKSWTSQSTTELSRLGWDVGVREGRRASEALHPPFFFPHPPTPPPSPLGGRGYFRSIPYIGTFRRTGYNRVPHWDAWNANLRTVLIVLNTACLVQAWTG